MCVQCYPGYYWTSYMDSCIGLWTVGWYYFPYSTAAWYCSYIFTGATLVHLDNVSKFQFMQANYGWIRWWSQYKAWVTLKNFISYSIFL